MFLHFFSQVQCYDPEDNKWTLLSPTPFYQRCISAVCLDNIIYVVGGLLSKIFSYDPRKDSWREVATLPGPLVRNGFRKEALSLPSPSRTGVICALLRLKAKKVHCGIGSKCVNVTSAKQLKCIRTRHQCPYCLEDVSLTANSSFIAEAGSILAINARGMALWDEIIGVEDLSSTLCFRMRAYNGSSLVCGLNMGWWWLCILV